MENQEDIAQETEVCTPRRIAMFGGSFDPVTNAHYNIVKDLSERFDKVIVLPCFLSPFKTDANIAQPALRIKMLEKAFDGMQNVKVSKWEIKREQCSYSYLTVMHFAQKYPCDKLYFVVGSDGLSSLPQWKNVLDIATYSTFYIVNRPDFAIKQDIVDEFNKKGYNIEVADFSGEVTSSSQARVANAFGKIREVVPKSVAKFIEKNELYPDYIAITANYKVFNLKEERIEHIYRAAKVAITLAKINGININSAITAVLLHDIGKSTDEALLKRLNIAVPEFVNSMPDPIKHAPISAVIAREYFNIADNDILNAIAMHTTGDVNMSPLQMLVFVADAIEEGRDIKDLKVLRDLSLDNLEKGTLAILKNTIDYVSQKDEVYFKTLEAYEFYKNLLAKNVEKAKPKKKKPEQTKQIEQSKQIEQTKQIEQSKQIEQIKQIEQNKQIENNAAAKNIAQKEDKMTTEKKETGMTPDEMAKIISNFLDEKKAKDITIIDLNGKTIIADYFVVASATSTTAVKALSEYVDEKLSKDYGIEPLRRDIDSKWAAIDYGCIILHIFHEETRGFYQLEKLWDNGKNVLKYENK